MRLLPQSIKAAFLVILLPSALVEADSAASAAPVHSLPTPALIERAVSKGRIDRDRGTLYLAYALARPGKLPSAYRSDIPWDGTVPLLELQRAERTMARGPERTEINQILSEQTGPGSCGPSGSSLPNNTTTPHFYVEYGSIGGGLTIDSYMAALETSWVTEVDTFGWGPPPVWPPNSPPGNRYHVRVDALAPNVYGYVTNGGAHAGFIGNNPNTAWDDTDSYATCMVLRSDYSEFPSSPQASLDSTVAHEFNHSIQFGYGALHGANKPDLAFIEGGATWMEDEVFDGSNDNYFFLWPPFTESIGDNPSPWYSNWITFRGMTERYGTGMADGAEQVMQDFWEETSKNTGDNLTALQTALANRGASLADAYHAYAIAVKFNKACGGDYVPPYCLEEGPAYVAAEGATTVHDTIPSIGGILSRTIEDNYALNWIGLPTGGPYDVTLTNNDSGGMLRGSVVCDTGSGLSIHRFPSVVGAGGSSTVAQFPGCTTAVAVVTNEHQTAANPSSSEPRDYALSTSSPSASATLSVTKVGSGSGTVTSDVPGISCGSDCSENLPDLTAVTLTAVPAAGSVFSGWSGACTGTGACLVTVDTAKSVMANFTGFFQASVTKSGSGAGTVTSDVPGINCGQDCSEIHPFGTQLLLAATPAAGSAFKGWNGGGCSGASTCLVTVNWTKSIRATFADAVAPAMPAVGGTALSRPFQLSPQFEVSWGVGEGSPPEGARYDVRYRSAQYRATFAEPVAWQTTTLATSSAFSGTSGHAYCFSARASDTDLNTSEYGAEKCTAVPLNNTKLKHRGDWAKKKGKGYFLGTFSVSSQKGASLVLPGVQAKRLAIVVTKCPACGTIKVFLGNKLLRTIKLRASSIKKKRIVDVATFSSVRSGTLRAVVTSSGRPVKIEGIGVSRV